MATRSAIRQLILYALDEQTIDNSQFASDGSDPYAEMDLYSNQAEILVGAFLELHGAKPELIRKTVTIAFPASTRDVVWATLDPTGTIGLPGSKIYRIWDVTAGTNNPIEVPIIDSDKADLQEDAGVLGVTRQGIPRINMNSYGAVIYGDRISILPDTGMSRSFQMEFTKQYGQISATSDGILPSEAVGLQAIKAAALLMDKKGRDVSRLDKNYEDQKWTILGILHKSRAGTVYKMRGRYRGP